MIKKLSFLFAAVFVLLPLSACGASGEYSSDFFAMDTYMFVKTYGSDVSRAVKDEAERLESLFSVTDADSEIGILNANGSVEASDETIDLIERAVEISGATEGALDITVYPAVKAWGFTTGEYAVPSPEKIEELRSLIDCTKIRIEGYTVSVPDGFMIDLGAVAKGYLGDRVRDILKNAGITSAIADLGGNIVTVGSRPDGTPWRVAIRDPNGDGSVGVFEVTDRSVVTSGGYERYFTDENGVKRWHIIDPSAAEPADGGLLSATVIGEDGVLCDGLSTAIFVMGAEKAEAMWRKEGGFEMILVTKTGDVLVTDGIIDSFSLSEGSPYELKVIG
ncbi:MAG: FAD:protein FMN transferase [Clostridia bacterium]|nr:FAD:protein FMN transferase [Clostridia bacterium]